MTLEKKLSEYLPDGKTFTITAFELWHEQGGWSVNRPWVMSREVDKEQALFDLRARWNVFKLNYLPKACVKNIHDISDMDDGIRLEVDCVAFCDIEITN